MTAARQDINLADVIEAHASTVPDQDAIVQGDRRLSWREFDRRASGVATALIKAGLDRGDRVALYLYDVPEYLEGHMGALKASLVPVNTNYRYVDDELRYLWDDADALAVVFHGAFAPTIDRIRARVPGVRLWLWVDDGQGECPEWAIPYESAAETEPRPAPWPRSTTDLVFVYTGGTTGLPKGVMWRQDLYLSQLPDGTDDLGDYAAARAAARRRTVLPAAPLMHGTGVAAALSALTGGGTVVLLEGRRFDPAELWSTVEREGVGTIALVGDVFARPLADELDRHPREWDLGSLRSIISAGAMFSAPVKQRLSARLPTVKLVDQLGSSENANGAFSISEGATVEGTSRFRPVSGVRVLNEDGHDVEPGSGEVGVIAIPGGAEGYHKDPQKSAKTWPVIDGTRYTVAGDYATIMVDGTLGLLGRGSGCINTGGEKVYPEEVEEALKSHASVLDAVVVGVPHERYGQCVAAVIEVATDVSDEELTSHAGRSIARYKLPRHMVRVSSVGRAPNGKADYAGARRHVIAHVGSTEVD